MKQLAPLFILLVCICTVPATSQLHSLDENHPCLEKTFPVLIHLTVDSTDRQQFLGDMQVTDMMNKVSSFFEPICMAFEACEINVIENYTFHNIVDPLRLEELKILFGKPRRLNVYILGDIPNASCGVSTTYGINEKGGEYIFLETEDCEDELAGQLAHHLGHYFGLQDTYHGSTLEIVNDANCAVVADSICDTPSDPFGKYRDVGDYEDVQPGLIEMIEFVQDCEFIHENLDPNGNYYQPDVGNIMSAYPCRCGFTNEQFRKMSSNYLLSSHKPY